MSSGGWPTSGCAAIRAGDLVDGVRSALIVASYDYSDAGLKQLHGPASDARALAAVLQDPEIGAFEVRTLLNEPAHEVNLAVEEFFADRRPDDLLLVHFSCHGVKDESGDLYFAMANTRLRRLGATAVAADFVNRRMSRSHSRRVVLLLDCCYAGAFERGMTAKAGEGIAIESQFSGRGRAVITASSAMEYAFEGDHLTDTREQPPSVFTSALVEGLETGDADRDQDGLVALDEMYDYVFEKVRATTPNQTPGKWTFGVQGELIIARRSRPVTSPAPLPRELEEAIDSPFTAIRVAAVQELVRLLQGRHAGLALAARLALEQLTEDDSRTVTAAAVAGLGGQAEPPVPPPTKPRPSVPPGFELAATTAASEYPVPAHTDAPAQEDVETPGASISTEALDENEASTSGPAEEPLATPILDIKDSAEDHEQVGSRRPPRTQPLSPTTQKARTPPDAVRTPAGQPRRIPAKVWTFGGGGVGLILIVVLIAVVLANSHATRPNSTLHFTDDFSTTVNAWTVAKNASGQYANGKYKIRVPSLGSAVFAWPTANMPDPAPPNITIQVSARATGNASMSQYGIECRGSGPDGYQFSVSNGMVTISKSKNGAYSVIYVKSTTAVSTKGKTNQLRAMCTSTGGQNPVHLVLWVNGEKLADVTDRSYPLPIGRTEIFAGKISPAGEAAEVEFDNFAVTQT
jgi:hypothetical protein